MNYLVNNILFFAGMIVQLFVLVLILSIIKSKNDEENSQHAVIHEEPHH